MDTISDNKLKIPDSVSRILKTIRNAGFEAFIVGGCVRDILLGRVPGDWDITTSALPEDIKGLFHATVDSGIKHGTVMVLAGGCGYEVTTYRIDGEYKDGRHPESVIFTPSLEEDLKRRDFTINAFAYDPEVGIVDLFNGQEDLAHGVIRAVGDPYKRFDEDALRIMRAVRFSAQLSFKIEEETKSAIAAFAEKLALVSAERIRVEFEKTLYSDNPSYVNMYRKLGLAQYIVPEVSGKCFQDSSVCIYNNLASSDMTQVLRLAAFFKDLSFDECRRVMRRMTFDNRRRDLVSGVLKNHLKIADLDHIYMAGHGEAVCKSGTEIMDVRIRKTLSETGMEIFSLCLDFNEACGHNMTDIRHELQTITERGDAYTVSMLDITGSDLMEAGVPQGKQIGETLNHLLDAVIEDPELNHRERLLELV